MEIMLHARETSIGDIDTVEVTVGRVSSYAIDLRKEGGAYFIKSMRVMTTRNFQSSFFNTALFKA